MLNWIRDHVRLAVVGFVITFLFFGYVIHRIDQKDHAVRCAVVKIAQDLTTNSERTLHATLDDPAASAERKDAAQKNLDTIRAFRETIDGDVGDPKCTTPKHLTKG